MMAKFVIFLDDAGYYRWRLVAGNGEKVATSGEGFYSRQSAVRAAKPLLRSKGCDPSRSAFRVRSKHYENKK